jgi:hypothetical protein
MRPLFEIVLTFSRDGDSAAPRMPIFPSSKGMSMAKNEKTSFSL